MHRAFAVTSWRVTRIAGPRSTRRLWRICSFAGAAYLVGDIVQLVAVARHPTDPTSMTGTTAQVALVVLGTLALIGGMLACRLGITSSGARRRLNLDVGTVMVAAVTFGMLLFEPPPGDHDARWVRDLVAAVLIEPGVFLVAVFAVVKLVLGGQPPFTRAAGLACGGPPRCRACSGPCRCRSTSPAPASRRGCWAATCSPPRCRRQAPGSRSGGCGPPDGVPAGCRGGRTTSFRTWRCGDVRAARPRPRHPGTHLARLGPLSGAILGTSLVVVRQLAASRHITELLAERDALAHRLTELAFHDSLTGLPNRALFMDRLTAALGSRADGELAVVLVDLDGFKPVNDRYGHAADDELLRRVGGWLTEAVRAGDTVARLGGDEFAVLARDLPAGERDVLGARISAALHWRTDIGAAAIDARGSVGVAFARPGTSTPDQLLHDADLAMYAAKRRDKAPPLPSRVRGGRPG